MGGHSFGGLLTYWLAATIPNASSAASSSTRPPRPTRRSSKQIQPSLDRLGHVYPSWDDYLALVRAMPYFDEGGWEPRSRATSAPTCACARRHGAGALPARAHPGGDRGHARGRLAGARHPHRAAGAPAARAGQLRAARIASDPLPRRTPSGRRRRSPTARLVDGVGNHLTFVFGRGATRPERCDRRVPR